MEGAGRTVRQKSVKGQWVEPGFHLLNPCAGQWVTGILSTTSPKSNPSTSKSRPKPRCGMRQSGGYLDGIAPDGLMGLGLGEVSVPSLLAKAGLITNSFLMCIDEEGSGRIFFGDQGPNTQQSTSFLPSNGNYETYIVGVEACCIGNSCLKQTSFRALDDSRTSFTFLPEEVHDKIAVEFDKRVNATNTSYEGSPWKYCYNTRRQTTALWSMTPFF